MEFLSLALEDEKTIFGSGKQSKTLFELSEKELYKCLKQRLPAYMLPTRIVLTESLPLNRNGKTDEAALRKML